MGDWSLIGVRFALYVTLAALFGAIPAVLIGGIGTVGVALLWMRLFPALRDLERLE